MSSGLGPIQDLYAISNTNTSHHGITVGYVVDTNDKQQMGRVRVLCPALNDPNITDDFNLADIPWATYCSPLGGVTNNLRRGPEEDVSGGSVAYGMWNIPKIGAEVIVSCLDGDPQYRIWMGCLHSQFMTHTLPSGRYHVEGTEQDGPFTSTGDPVQPLYYNYADAYSDRSSFEWKTRGVDYQAAALDSSQLNATASEKADDKEVDLDGNTIKQGYQSNQILTKPNVYDNQVFSWTTPGFHTISMDDRFENCRMRLRTTTGHQILLDDTNERILLSTNKANVWVEMDSAGNLDIFADKFMNFHSGKDMNFTSDGTIRMRGKDGIHFTTPGDFRTEVQGDMHTIVSGSQHTTIVADAHMDAPNIHFNASVDANITAGGNVNLNAGADAEVTAAGAFGVDAGGNIDLNAGGNLNTGSGGDTGIMAGGNLLTTGAAIHLNGPPAPGATPSGATTATASSALYAFATNRVPFKTSSDGKSWSRGMLDPTKTDKPDSTNLDVIYNDYSFFEVPYAADSANKVFLGESVERGIYWRR